MRRIGYIVMQNFKNDSRVLKQAMSLASQGYKVTVFALGDDDLPVEEELPGVLVLRMRLKTRRLPKHVFFQFFKYLEYMLKIAGYRKDLDIVNASSLAPLPIAVFLKMTTWFRMRVIYDARELETETTGLKGLRKRVSKASEKFFIRYIDGMSTVSESIAEDYAARYHIRKPVLLYNAPPPVPTLKKHNLFRERLNIPSDKLICLYQGGLTPGRGLELLLDTFSNGVERCVLVIMGYGGMEEKIKSVANRSENVFFHPAVPPVELLKYTSSADVGITLIENTCLSYYYCMPNKLFEYAMAGLPILASDLLEMRKIIQNYQCGLLIENMSTDAVKKAITTLLQSNLTVLSDNSRRFAIENSWAHQEPKLFQLYREVEGYRTLAGKGT